MPRDLRRCPGVLRVAKAKNGDEDWAQEQQPERETGAFPEGLRDTDHDHGCDHDVDDWARIVRNVSMGDCSFCEMLG